MGKAHQPGTFKSVIFKQKLSIMFDICSANVAHVFNTPALTVANVLNEMGGGGILVPYYTWRNCTCSGKSGTIKS